MTLKNLDNLVAAKQLKHEAFNQSEYDNLLNYGKDRLKDAKRTSNGLESQFLLAYSAAHSVSLAALRRLGYRADNRYIVFQSLPHTVGAETGCWRLLAKAHDMRNVAEYEGFLDVSESFVGELIEAIETVFRCIEQNQA